MESLRGQRRQHGFGYLLAVAATAAVALLRRFFNADAVGLDGLLYLLLFVVLAAAWLDGLKAGLLATVLSVLDVLIVRDRGLTANTGDPLRIAIFLLAGAAISWFIELAHRSRSRADQQSESLRITLASIGDAVVTTDAKGRIASLNAVATALTGWMQDEAVGRPLEEVFRIINEWTRQIVENPAQKVLASGKPAGLANHTVLIAKDGTERPIDDSASPIRDAEGQLKGVVLVFRDISERRRAERTRLRLAAIVESSDDAVFSKDLNGILTSWNQGAERLYGYSAEEVIGKPVSLLFPPDRAEELSGILERLKRGERIEHYETIRVRKDGQRFEAAVTVSPLMDQSGQIIGGSDITRDISERKRLYQQLQDADRRKDEFLAILAHELRNPLAPIRNALEILRLAGDNKAALEHVRTIMERQLQQMVRLIDDLLDVSRITRDKLVLRKEPIELAAVVRQAVETSRPLIEASGHQFTVAVPDEPIPVDADAARLAQVFANLLNNAAKYTERGGRIGLTVQREGNEAVVTVMDTGVGIRAEHLPHIFEMFAQVDQSLERSQGGLGIGLTLVKRLTEMHGGTVEARSDGPNKGSAFRVRLPILSGQIAQPQPPSGECESKAVAVPCKVLIVDDHQDTATSMSTILHIMGHDVRVAHDGQQAVVEAASYQPDVILLDISLPKMSGHEVARRIREQPKGRHVKLVALTGWGQEEDKRRAKDAGFDHYLIKPVEPAALEELLKKFCPIPT